MSYTDYLQLFKHDNPTTNTDIFDVDKALNQNWDKIDEGLEDAVNKFTEPLSYKGEVTNISDLPSGASNGDIYNVTSVSKNYIWNGTEWVEYSSTIDFTELENKTKATITTEEAKEHTIIDSAEVNGKIHITGGETEQDTTTGKNKVHYATGSTGLNGLTVTENSDGSVNISGTPSTNWANITPDISENIASGDYIFSINQTFNFRVGLAVFTSGGTQTNFRIMENNKSIAVNLSANQTKYRIFIEGINTSTNYNIQNLEIMLRPASTDDTYEKYTGGIVSPNPDYPQDVVSVGTEGSIDFLIRNKNLFVKNNTTEGYLKNDGTIQTASGFKVSEYIDLSNFENITISGNAGSSEVNCFYDKNKEFVTAFGMNSDTTKTQSIPDNVKYLRTTIKDSALNQYQIEEGLTATTYVEGKQQTISVPLPEGMEFRKTKTGDYKDYPHKIDGKWYKHKVIDSYTFVSNENWVALSHEGCYTVYKPTPTKLGSTTYTPYCTNLIGVNNQNFDLTTTNNSIGASGDRFNIYVPSITNVSDVKSAMAGQTVYYVLATPVEEEITDTDTLEALYQIEHLLMYEGYTSIECLNDVQPDIKVEYYYDNEINNSYAKRLDEVDDSIKELDERVDNIEGEVYSTDETKIGTWIDGKPIYRKVIDFGALPNSTQKAVAYNISNLDIFTNVYGTATNGTTTFPLPMIALSGLNNSVQLNIEGGNIYLVTSSNRSSFTAIIILEYTKTTDTATT